MSDFPRILQIIFGLLQELGILLAKVDLDEVPLQKVLRDSADPRAAVERALVARTTGHLKLRED